VGEGTDVGRVYGAIRPLVFRMDPERAHMRALQAAERVAPLLGVARLRVRDERLAQRVWGLRFPNPVGLGAGYDKWGRGVRAWHALGFGFAEIGTVTALAQDGNPAPRLVRLPADRAVINRMGFNNDGAAATAQRLAQWDRAGILHRIPVGVNIGKSKVTPLEEAQRDYVESLDRLWPYADYIVVNVSSPNTPGLRDLQDSVALGGILDDLVDLNRVKASLTGSRRRPILVKVAPDLSDDQFDAAVDQVQAAGVHGIIVCNTTLSRSDLRSESRLVSESGGLSGAPLAARSLELLRRSVERAPDLPVISVGGVATVDDVWQRLAAGASLVQLWTALIYGGPTLVARINRGLVARMDAEGVRDITELIGSDRRA
jgi:dihydroorotate dehydrogenase